jgi:tetratricopeptide (TPR) repeat protein
MNKLQYAVFLGLLALGLGGSMLLVPSQNQLGLLYFKARQNRQAKPILEQRLKQGEHTIDVVVPLADIYMQSGDVDRALALLNRFPVPPEQRLELARRIGQFESFGQRTRDYLRTLEKINRIKRSEAVLREIAVLYRYFNQVGPLTEVLEELIDHYPGMPDEFIELANLQAIAGKLSAAASTLEKLEKRHPEAITGDAVEFLISALLDAGEGSRAQARAAKWLAQHRTPDEAVRLAELLNSHGKPQLGLRLIERLEPTIDANPALLAEWVHLQVASGGSGRAFERLNALRLSKHLPGEMLEPFLDLPGPP